MYTFARGSITYLNKIIHTLNHIYFNTEIQKKTTKMFELWLNSTPSTTSSIHGQEWGAANSAKHNCITNTFFLLSSADCCCQPFNNVIYYLDEKLYEIKNVWINLCVSHNICHVYINTWCRNNRAVMVHMVWHFAFAFPVIRDRKELNVSLIASQPK